MFIAFTVLVHIAELKQSLGGVSQKICSYKFQKKKKKKLICATSILKVLQVWESLLKKTVGLTTLRYQAGSHG